MREEPSNDVSLDTKIDSIIETLPFDPRKRYKVTESSGTSIPNQEILVQARQQTMDLFFTIDSVTKAHQNLLSDGDINAEKLILIEREVVGIHEVTQRLLKALRTWDTSPDEAREALFDSDEVLGIFRKKYNWPTDEDSEEYPFEFSKEVEKIGPLRDVIHSLNGTSFGISNNAESYRKAKEGHKQKYIDSIIPNISMLRLQNIDAIDKSERGYEPMLMANGDIYKDSETELKVYSKREAALKGIDNVQVKVTPVDRASVISNRYFIKGVWENTARNAAEYYSQLPPEIKSEIPLMIDVHSEESEEFLDIIIADNGIGLKLEQGQERVDFEMGKSSSGGNGVAMGSLAISARKLEGDLYMRPRKDGQRGTEVVLTVKKANALPQ